LILLGAARASADTFEAQLGPSARALESFTTQPDPLMRKSKTIGSSNGGRRKPARSKLSSFWAAKTPF
jgi:hypothetical protein